MPAGPEQQEPNTWANEVDLSDVVDAVLAVRALSNLFSHAFVICLPLIVLHPFHAGALMYGALLALRGLTVVAAAALSGLRMSDLRWLYYVSWAVSGTGFVMVGVAANALVGAAGIVVSAAGSPLISTARRLPVEPTLFTASRVQMPKPMASAKKPVTTPVIATSTDTRKGRRHDTPRPTITSEGRLTAGNVKRSAPADPEPRP